MDFFISNAFAEAGAKGSGTDFSGIIMIVVLGIAMYLLMIRPQQKKQKEHKKLMENLTKGDEIISSGGILGKIKSVGENFVTVDLGSEQEIKLQRQAISTVLPKGTIKNA